MPDWHLIDHNSHNGVRKYLADHPDDPDGCLVRVEQSAEAIKAHIDRNKVAANHYNTGKMGDMAHAASIPVGVMYEWKQKYNVDAWKYASDYETRKRVNALLNSSDYRYLKVRNIII